MGLPAGVRVCRERYLPDPVPLHVQPRWAAEFPWLIQGTTGRGDDGAWDFGLAGRTPVVESLRRWRTLRNAVGVPRAVHSAQVHEDRLLFHAEGPPGLTVSEGFDGHVTRRPGILLTVSVADCVPVFLLHAPSRTVALLHAGWRGTARRILAAGLDALDAEPASVLVHLGPAICGRCYEVGPEVHEALGLPVPPGPTPVDLRAVQARQALEAGVHPSGISLSAQCTRCGDGFHSHRAGSPGRQLGVLGLRP